MIKRLIVVLAVVLTLVLGMTVPALAATTADVTVTATPSYVSIAANFTGTFDFGFISASATGNTSNSLIGITNSSSVQIDCTIGTNSTIWCANGLAWTVNANGTASDGGAGLYAYSNATLPGAGVIVNNTGTNQVASDLGAGKPFTYGLQLKAPSVYADGTQKSVKITVTAAAG